MKDQQIILGLKDKQGPVISYAIEILRQPVGYKLRSQGASKDAIDDITVDFLLSFIERLQDKTIHLKSASFVTYAANACYYMWLYHQKIDRKMVPIDENTHDYPNFDPPKDILELIDISERHRFLLKALEQLEHPCKTIAQLRLFTSKTWRIIAEEVDENQDNIRRQGQSCLNKLYKIWQRYYP